MRDYITTEEVHMYDDLSAEALDYFVVRRLLMKLNQEESDSLVINVEADDMRFSFHVKLVVEE